MVDVSLKDLIKSGHFGPIRLGMNMALVESFLGAPDDWSTGSRKYSRASILKYGDFEFHFDPRDKGLWLMHLEQLEAPSGGKTVSLDAWVVRPSLTLSEMEGYLSRGGYPVPGNRPGRLVGI